MKGLSSIPIIPRGFSIIPKEPKQYFSLDDFLTHILLFLHLKCVTEEQEHH